MKKSAIEIRGGRLYQLPDNPSDATLDRAEAAWNASKPKDRKAMTKTKRISRKASRKSQELVPGKWEQGPPPAMPMTETEAVINAITLASRDPKVDIAKLDWLLKTRNQLLDTEAEQAFNDALGRVQAAIEPVRKNAANDQTHSRYATYTALDAAIRPAYSAEGIALSFDTADHPDPLTIVVVCYVTRGRHKRTYSIPMPCDGKGPKGNSVMTRTHATGSGISYGRRYLLGMIFNVVVADKNERDDDGNAAGRIPRQAYPDDPLETGELASASKIAALRGTMKRAEVPDDLVLETFGIDKLEDLTNHQCAQAAKKCNKKLELMHIEEKASQQPVQKDVFPGDLP